MFIIFQSFFFQKADVVDALAHELAEGVVPRTREDGVE